MSKPKNVEAVDLLDQVLVAGGAKSESKGRAVLIFDLSDTKDELIYAIADSLKRGSMADVITLWEDESWAW